MNSCSENLEFFDKFSGSATLAPYLNLTLVQHAALWVRLGLLEFIQQMAAADSPLVGVLKTEIRDLSQDFGLNFVPGWKHQHAVIQEKLASVFSGAANTEKVTALEHLVRDLQLPTAQLFVLALVGESQSSLAINLVIKASQAPEKHKRLTVHLAAAILRCLFPEADQRLSVSALAEAPIISSHLLSLNGNDPTPFRELDIDGVLWSTLSGRQVLWPGCAEVPPPQKATLAHLSLEEIGKLAALFSGASNMRAGGVVVRGYPHSGRKQFAACLAEKIQLKPLKVPLQKWTENSQLQLVCRYGKWLPIIEPVLGPGEVCRLPAFEHPVVVVLGTDGAVEATRMLEVELVPPTEAERRSLSAPILQNDALAAEFARQARLSGESVLVVSGNAKMLAEREACAVSTNHIAEARRQLGTEKLRLLAQPIFRHVDREALVLPQHVIDGLDNLIARAHKRESLWYGLGKTLQVSSNSGVRGLFVGESGTGKTLAASYIASALSAPLYRVDLSAVMNKYIGESEKNLSQLLDHAAASDVVLLFDEADSLFGSRTDGNETGERFANMLTNFLLSRIESYTGIVVLTTNSSERIDNAFGRRLDVVVEFPLPGFDERLNLWRSHLGDRGPGDKVYELLASHCQFAGGQIRNAVITSAVHAQTEQITARDLYAGLLAEYQKIGRNMPAKIQHLAGL